MAAKISKDELAEILRNISSKEDFDSMQVEIEKVAEEYGIDLTEPEEVDDFDPLAEDAEIFINEDEEMFFEDEDEIY